VAQFLSRIPSLLEGTFILYVLPPLMVPYFLKKKKEESRKKKIAIDLEKEPNYEKFKIHTFPSTDMQSLFSVCTVLN
jgi:hypothetical protein